MVKTLKARDGSTYTATMDEQSKTWSVDNYPVFAVGRWHDDDYDETAVDRLIEFTNRAMKWVLPKLGIGHPAPGQNETMLPSFGRFGELFRDGARVLSRRLERIPGEIIEQMERGQLGPVSVQMRKFRDPETGESDFIFDRVKFLGLVAPEVATIAPSTEFSSVEEVRCYSTDDYASAVQAAIDNGPSDPTEANSGIAEQGGVMSDDLKAREESLAEDRAKFERQKADELAEIERKRTEMDERAKAQFTANVDAAWNRICPIEGERRATPGEKETFTEAATEIGRDGKAFSALVTAWMARPPIKVNKGKEQSVSDEVDRSIEDRMFSAAREVMKERGIGIAEATAIVAEQHPEWGEWDKKNFACQRAGHASNLRIMNA